MVLIMDGLLEENVAIYRPVPTAHSAPQARNATKLDAQNELAFRKRRVRNDSGDPEWDRWREGGKTSGCDYHMIRIVFKVAPW
jgi:hypothetical protein